MTNNTVLPVFRMPGRLRVKIKAIYKNQQKAMEIRECIIKDRVIFYVKYNIFTSSFLILYDYTSRNDDEIIQAIRESIHVINKAPETKNIF